MLIPNSLKDLCDWQVSAMKEKHIIAYDPSNASFNYGDRIISQSAISQLNCMMPDSMIFNFTTHTPNFEQWQKTRHNGRYRLVMDADYKFVCGSNILSNALLRLWPNFNINLLNKKEFKGAVLMAVGSTGQSVMKADAYTKHLIKSTFSKDYYHSTRDEITKEFLESLGLKAINTGCVTMWGLTPERCAGITKTKSDSVVFTLTNERPDVQNDTCLVQLLKNNYKKVYFCPQSAGDTEYFCSLCIDGVDLLNPDINLVSEFYKNTSVDYIGTRLHGGIYAMQHQKRSIILAVDNRAKDIDSTYNINCIARDDCDAIENKINSTFDTDVKINIDAINQWKSQF